MRVRSWGMALCCCGIHLAIDLELTVRDAVGVLGRAFLKDVAAQRHPSNRQSEQGRYRMCDNAPTRFLSRKDGKELFTRLTAPPASR
jgi:hypothetical protein